MAVIKIVPMPGAVGDKGDEGAPGAQGQQGPAGQNGLPGTPALWSYQGAWNSSAAYAVGDIVVYQGQLYYTKSVTTAGTLPTVTAKFDLIASKGADGTNGTNGTNGADGAPGADFGIYYLGNYNRSSGYVPDIAVVRGSDGQLYLAKASGQLGDPVGNTAQWEVWIPKGQDGADGATPFTLVGAYDNGASYNLGIAVYYNGGTYVRTGNPLNPGYPPTLGAINESWTPIAEKGADGSQLNYWDGASVPQDPAEDGFLIVDGIVGTNGSNILVSADDRVFIGGNNGEFLNGLSTPENQIATIGDLTTPTSGTWNPRFAELSNITYSDATSLHELGEYYCVGDLVFFDVLVKLNNVSDWGTYTGSLETAGSIIWSFELPFIERHQAMAGWQNGMPDPIFVGKIYDSTIAEDISQRTARDQGSYPVYGELSHTNPNTVYLYVTAYDNYTGSAVGELRPLNKSYPSDLTQPEVQQSGFRMSGVYRKA